jgi:hypothetical protein
MAVPFALEQQVAIAAVRRACALTTTIFNKLVAGETLVKGDNSPVTGAPRTKFKEKTYTGRGVNPPVVQSSFCLSPG